MAKKRSGVQVEARAGSTHLNLNGELRQVDVSGKPVSVRAATASSAIRSRPEVIDALCEGSLSKGEALAAARIAGIQAAKRTSDWIPLCHTLALDCVEMTFRRDEPDTLTVLATVRTTARTGVEMEALTAVSASALTLYDMAKSLDKAMVIGPTRLESKSGGKSGPYRRRTP